MNGLLSLRLLTKSTINFCGLIGLLYLTSCQRTTLQLLRTATEEPDTMWVKTVRIKPHHHQLVVVDVTGRKQRLSADSTWGYRTNQGDTYRLYQDGEYQVVQRGPLVIYRTEEWYGDSVWEAYYFSLSAEGAIFDLDKQTCLRVFCQDGCMVKLLNQMRNRQLTNTDGHGSYGLANAYSYCHGQNLSGR